MKNVKKLIALLLAITCMLTFAACGGEGSETTAPVTPDETLDEQIDDVFEQMESIGSENAGQEVGSYAEGSDADFVWESVEGGVAITEYIGTATTVSVPAQLGGQNVVEIGEGAFADSAVVGVSLPDTVVNVNKEAFYYCMALVEVKLGSGTVMIGEDAFHGCVALSSVHLNNGLKTIGESAFALNDNLKNITIPNTVETIEKGAFIMSGLTSVTIPGSVQTVGEQAFSTCTKLTTVVVEDGVKEFGDEVFQGCKNLESATIPASVTEMGWDTFIDCDKLVIHAPAGSAAESHAAEFGHKFQSN